MNLPNKITLLRVLMIPIFLVILLVEAIPYNEVIALIVFALACITDAIDGHIARKHNLITDFGKFMDPLADKLLVSAALICFTAQGLVPAWIVVVIISREFIISGFRTIAVEKGVVIAAGKSGKLKTAVQMVMCILFIINFDNEIINIVEQVFMWLALVLTVVSLTEYLYKNRKIITEGTM